MHYFTPSNTKMNIEKENKYSMKVFYHNDKDGRCSAATVALFTGNYEDKDYIECDYTKPLPLNVVTDGEVVYILDIAFTTKTVFQLVNLVNMGCDVTWIDHHKSSIDLLDHARLEWLKSMCVTSVLSVAYSGAALTYMHLYGVDYDQVPYAVKLVDDYDRWIYALDPDTTHFNVGLDTVKHNALDAIWRDLLSSDSEKLGTLIDKGAIIKDYIDRDNESYRDSLAFETIVSGYKCLAVNKKSNAWIFGDKNDKYPLVMTMTFNGEVWQYTIYSSDKSIDCSTIAKSYGGGGHPSAAGWTSEELLFRKI